ncbi:hypothetical protein MXD61_13940 [Frankia sp. AgPm24]|uniref:Uncharacterized protein n=1 Tax=Frankia umida TaxID=573489 RepID=A0ABT0K1R2_9ACTN|nr:MULTISPECIES: hypothetical protein [Frankia]MCK9877741.1 hypothetical protein [Frankia umida]MCK9922959.1 hypothetical protein [Frankia sp. AgPm24]
MVVEWKFVDGVRDRLDTDPADVFSENRMTAVRDWLMGDIQRNRESLKEFRESWREVLQGKYEGTSGNVTDQTLAGDEVVFDSLIERWDEFSMPVAEMFAILDKFEEYLDERATRRQVASTD